jgi:hypothetical protein
VRIALNLPGRPTIRKPDNEITDAPIAEPFPDSTALMDEADLADGSDGLEYVTFVITKEGKVSTINRVDSKKEACEGCSKAVITAILDMPDWQPAMLGGNPVNVVVTLPVRFRVI